MHTLAVRRAYEGRALGASMLRWAADLVRAQGRRYLRLDCAASSVRLRGYYEALGFRFCGLASWDGYTGALMELNLDLGSTPEASSAS